MTSSVFELSHHGFHELPVFLQLLHRPGPPAAETSVTLALKPVLSQPFEFHLHKHKCTHTHAEDNNISTERTFSHSLIGDKKEKNAAEKNGENFLTNYSVIWSNTKPVIKE